MTDLITKVPRFIVAVLLSLSTLFVGCSTMGSAGAATPKHDGKAVEADRIVLRKGDVLKIMLVPPKTGGTPTAHQDYVVTIKEDGTVALPYFPSIQAADKTPAELEQEIYNKYVPDYYKSLGVTVEPAARFFYVSGEVNKPDRHEYIGGITVTRAISSSQGFTEYANRKKVKLIRANGKMEKVNWNEAIENPSKDPQVYPGDTVEVPRRVL